MMFRSTLRLTPRVAVAPTLRCASTSARRTPSAFPTTGLVLTGITLAGAGVALTPTHAADAVDEKALRSAIADILDKDGYDDGSIGPVLVRLAWHSSGSYNKADGTGGSNGACMRFKPESDFGANAGLDVARAELEVIKAKFPAASYSDIYTLAAVVAIEEMGGPVIPWTSGRTDTEEGKFKPVPDGRLPDAAQGAQHMRDIFYAYGFNDREIVALAGAHALGRCHPNRSGFEGPWTRAPTTFSNEYFRLLLEETWIPGKSSAGQFQYWNKDKSLMMLPADLSFRDDPKFRQYTEMYAKDEELFFKDFASACGKLFDLGRPSRGFFGSIAGWFGY